MGVFYNFWLFYGYRQKIIAVLFPRENREAFIFSGILCYAKSGISLAGSDIAPDGRSGILFAKTRGANTTLLHSNKNITAKQYHSPQANKTARVARYGTTWHTLTSFGTKMGCRIWASQRKPNHWR